MKIRARFFAMCRDVAGCDSALLNLPDGGTGEEFWQEVVAQYPGLSRYRATSRLAVHMEYVENTVQLREGDEVCIIPPVSGG